MMTLKGEKLILDMPVEFTQGLKRHGNIVSGNICLEQHLHGSVQLEPDTTEAPPMRVRRLDA
ncbi:MAG TPA: hypothetical protein ACQGQH_04060 [Xylella sp.]